MVYLRCVPCKALSELRGKFNNNLSQSSLLESLVDCDPCWSWAANNELWKDNLFACIIKSQT